ncbi:MAG: chemotaxis protein CheA [Desulfuromonadaceae bacterium]|nr:chemotaxis protein CheA [Desulfuromonadaceae bacterium]
MDSPQQAFKEEAYELLTELETALLELEECPDDMEIIGQVFRAMHTIKGSGAMFGFTDISSFTHEVETVYDLVRSGEMKVTKTLVDLSLQARDHILGLLDAVCEGQPADLPRSGELVRQFQALIPGKTSTPAFEVPVQEEKAEIDELQTYRIRFNPSPEILKTGTRMSALLDELAELGTCRTIAHKSKVPPLDQIDPELCYVSWDILLTSPCREEEIRDVFIFVEDECEIRIRRLDIGSDGEEQQKRLGDILIERGDITQDEIDKVIAKSRRIGEMLVDARLVDVDAVESALQEQQLVRQLTEKRKEKTEAPASSSLRVPAERLDELVNLVGEMVTVQSRLSQTAALSGDSELQSIAEEVERLTEELRDSTLNIRMLPIGSTFSKFKRLVRDIASDLKKEVDFQTAGAETELDKTVIEQLNDPLVHIIRNSMDHGLELPDVRQAAGKPRQGTVFLGAQHSGDSVVIEIRDDGKGLNTDVIREKAISKGLIGPDENLSDQEIYQLIFAPGFSTAQQVTGLSGRGVGMDVVKRAIEALRGTISLDSTLGKGTTVRLRIPLTLAIIESLLVKIGSGSFVLPLSAVEECVELTQSDIEDSHGRCLANVRGTLIPYIPLRNSFAIPGPVPPIQQIVITRIDGQQVGFVVDTVIGEHQTVIKSLGPMYRDVRCTSGATILGDGSVALILDLVPLTQQHAVTEAARLS